MCVHMNLFKWLCKVKCESQKNYQHHTNIHKYAQMLKQFKQCSLIWAYATSRQWVPLAEGQITNQRQQTLLKLHMILWLGGISDAAIGILKPSFQTHFVTCLKKSKKWLNVGFLCPLLAYLATEQNPRQTRSILNFTLSVSEQIIGFNWFVYTLYFFTPYICFIY